MVDEYVDDIRYGKDERAVEIVEEGSQMVEVPATFSAIFNFWLFQKSC